MSVVDDSGTTGKTLEVQVTYYFEDPYKNLTDTVKADCSPHSLLNLLLLYALSFNGMIFFSLSTKIWAPLHPIVIIVY